VLCSFNSIQYKELIRVEVLAPLVDGGRRKHQKEMSLVPLEGGCAQAFLALAEQCDDWTLGSDRKVSAAWPGGMSRNRLHGAGWLIRVAD
jgi:hypothetical protein